jgi:hypothetical protein
MATWSLSPQYKKSAVEKMFFYKDGKCITIEQGFRWATFKVESDERPLTDEELKNKDGYELSCIANDESWEMWDMIDGCWLDIEAARDNTTDEDVETFTEAWEEDSYDGVESLGWNCDDTEYYYHGPLELTNESTGEVFQGESDENVSVGGVPVQTEEQLIAELDTLLDTMPVSEEPALTDWFPADIKPVHKGEYQVITKQAESWPFPTVAEWDGKKWNEDVKEWRGLAEEPKRAWPF